MHTGFGFVAFLLLPPMITLLKREGWQSFAKLGIPYRLCVRNRRLRQLQRCLRVAAISGLAALVLYGAIQNPLDDTLPVLSQKWGPAQHSGTWSLHRNVPRIYTADAGHVKSLPAASSAVLTRHKDHHLPTCVAPDLLRTWQLESQCEAEHQSVPALDKFSFNTDIALSRPSSTRQFTYAASEQLLLHAVLRDTATDYSRSQCFTDSTAGNITPEAADVPLQQMQMPASSLGIHSQEQALGSWPQCSASALDILVLDVLTCGVDSHDQPFTADSAALLNNHTLGVKHRPQTTPITPDTVESIALQTCNLQTDQQDHLTEPGHQNPDQQPASTALVPYFSTASLLQHVTGFKEDLDLKEVCLANVTFARQTFNAFAASQHAAKPPSVTVHPGKGEQVYWC